MINKKSQDNKVIFQTNKKFHIKQAKEKIEHNILFNKY
jgi:hypothetical protein